MRIAIDAHCLGERMTGNETYVLNLVRALAEIDTHNQYHVLVGDDQAMPSHVRAARNVHLNVMISNWAPIRILAVLPIVLSRMSADLMHVNYIVPPMSPCPTIVTIHDISYEIFPEFFSPRDRWGLSTLVPWSVRRASKVIAVSEHTKRDLVRLYKLPEEKIVVTYEAAGGRFHPRHGSDEVGSVMNKYGLSCPYILTVGNLQPRKNLWRLIQAYSRVREQGLVHHRLAIVGQAHWRASEVFELVRVKGLEEEVVFTGYVPDEDLPPLYSGADLFVFPSLYEGFGLPIIEAMASGTPVVSSNAAALPEVAGKAAILVDPYDIEALAAAIARVVGDKGLRMHLVETGLRRAGQFSWEDTARKTLRVYEQAIGEMRENERRR